MIAVERVLRREMSPVLAALLSAAVLIGVLAYMIQERAAVLRNGVEVVLKAAPVDPRDLMRGDYVTLRYDGVSHVDSELLAGDWPEAAELAPVWVTLVPGEDGLAVVDGIHLEKPEDGVEGAVHLKSNPVALGARGADAVQQRGLDLTFGIERYYVPEGEGLEIEDARNAGRTTVAVRVSADGRAQIARLMIDGETLYREPLY